MFGLSRHRPSNPGSIWLDDPKASRAIDRKLRSREITEAEAEHLRAFSKNGYFTIPIELSAEDAAAIDRDIDRLWRERPSNVSFAYDSPPRRFSEASSELHRRPRSRIHDVHSASAVAMRLYLHPTLNRYASLVLGEQAVATQSLYFEHGSQQALHRDSIVVPTPQFGHLVAAWIALEDIDPASGPLAYVPDSHRLPFYQFRTGLPVYDPVHLSDADVRAAMDFYETERVQAKLSVKQFLARRGEVFIWHSALMHGGAPPANEQRTRKSLAVHYSTMSTHKTRETAVREIVAGADGESVYSTPVVLKQNGALGFANPLDGNLLYRR